jgi:hypothetical protein
VRGLKCEHVSSSLFYSEVNARVALVPRFFGRLLHVGETPMSVQIKQIARLVTLASVASGLVGCEWITRVDATGYSREVAKDGKELFCKNVGAGPGDGDCYTRRQLWDIQNRNPASGDGGIPPSMYPSALNTR